MDQDKYRVTDNPGHYHGARWFFLEEALAEKNHWSIIGGFRDEKVAQKVCAYLNDASRIDAEIRRITGLSTD